MEQKKKKKRTYWLHWYQGHYEILFFERQQVCKTIGSLKKQKREHHKKKMEFIERQSLENGRKPKAGSVQRVEVM